jgi:hypothetical protein
MENEALYGSTNAPWTDYRFFGPFFIASFARALPGSLALTPSLGYGSSHVFCMLEEIFATRDK